MPDTIYYLECIARRLKAIQESHGCKPGNMLGHIALADERDWLDSYIDELKAQEHYGK